MNSLGSLNVLQGNRGSFFDEALECLVRGEELKLSNFGVFSIKQKSERPGRNPKSGESAIIKARQVVSFHPSGQLRKKLSKAVSMPLLLFRPAAPG